MCSSLLAPIFLCSDFIIKYPALAPYMRIIIMTWIIPFKQECVLLIFMANHENRSAISDTHSHIHTYTAL